MKSKSGLEAVGAHGKASVFIANAHDRSYFVELSAVPFLLIALSAVIASLAGFEIFQPVFGEQSPSVIPTSDSVFVSTNSFPQTLSGNSYYRSMSESMSVIAGNGNSGTSSPVSYQRSVSESLSLTTIQGKAPNSYSRSMSEQISVNTGMPSSGSAGQLLRAAPTPTPYSAGSNQRIEERVSPTLKILGKKADTGSKNIIGGTSFLLTESIGYSQGESPGQHPEMLEISEDINPDDSSSFLDQTSHLSYISMQKSMENAAVANGIVSSTPLIATIAIVIAKHPGVSSGRIENKVYAIFVERKTVNVEPGNKSFNHVLILIIVIFTVAAITNNASPIIGEAFADNQAGLAYKTGITGGLEYREWNPSTTSWGSAVSLPSAGNEIYSVKFLYSPESQFRVIGVLESNGEIDIYYCESVCTSALNWYGPTLIADMGTPTAPYKYFDMAFESISGDLLIVYDKSITNDPNDFFYKVLNTKMPTPTLSNETGFDYVSDVNADNDIRFFKMASKPGADEIAMILLDATTRPTYAFIWNGSNFSSQSQLTTDAGAAAVVGESIGVAYETTSNAAIFFSADNTGGNNAKGAFVRWTVAWSGVTRYDINPGVNGGAGTGLPVWYSVKANPDSGSDDVMVCNVDSRDNDLSCIVVTGGIAGTNTRLDNSIVAITTKMFDFAWDPTGSTGIAIYDDTAAATSIKFRTWDGPATTWQAEQTVTIGSSNVSWFVSASDTDGVATGVDSLWAYYEDAATDSIADGEWDRISATTLYTHNGDTTITNNVGSTNNVEVVGVDFRKTAILKRTLSEQLAVTTTLVKKVVPSLSPEALNLTDSLSVKIAKSRSELLFLADSLQAKSSRSRLENINIFESIIKSVVKPSREQLGLVDLITITTLHTRNLSDQLTLSAIINMTNDKPMSDSLGTSDQLARTIISGRANLEQLGLQDNITISISKPLTEQMTLTDFRALSTSKSFKEQLGITDNSGRSIDVSRTFSDLLTISEKISMAVSKSMLEQLSIEVAVAPSIAAVTESLFVTDTVTKALSKPMAESLVLDDSLVRSLNQSRSVSEQLGLIDGIIAGRSYENIISEQLALAESISAYISSESVEQLTITDSVNSTASFARSVSESLVFTDTVSRTSFVVILESLNIQEQFTNISISFHLLLNEMLVLPDSLVTNQFGQFNHLAIHTLTIGDSVILSLQSGNNATPTESMNLNDTVSIIVLIRAPPSPPAITTMPNLTMTETQYVDLYDGLTDPVEAVKVNGVWNVTSLDEQGLQSLLDDIGMPAYDVNLEAASSDIDQMTIILPAFRVPANIDGQTSDDALFLTPTLSRLPAGIHVIVPIDVEASMDGAENLDHLGNITLTFTPSESVDNFTMMISLLDSNPEDTTDDLPADVAALYIDIAIEGNFGAITPDNPAFFQQSPTIEFTLAEEWAQTHNIERDSNTVPIVGMFLLDESTGNWVGISSDNINSPPSAVNNSYTFNATLPHFSTYVVTADTEDKSSTGGGSHAKFVIPLTDSLLITSGMNTGTPIGSEGKIVFKDITELLTLSIVQPQPLHQRVINIEDLSVAVSISDIKAAMFGTAIATMNLEITNKGDNAEKLILRYWYTDPATGMPAYESKEIVVVDAGQVIVKTVEIPFTTNGVFDIVIEAESDDRTVATTNIAVDVPWLTVYLQILVIIAIAIVLISISYVIRVMRTPKSLITGGK